MGRSHELERETRETRIVAKLDLDGTGQAAIGTGFAFADHMLGLLAFWSGFDVTVKCQGDMEIDAHHSLEDVGLCLGECLAKALGGKEGIARAGEASMPMDEALVQAVVDLSGRPYFVYQEDCLPPVIAGEEKDLWREFFKSLAFRGQMNLHLRFLYGSNGHHLLESAFKSLGLALGHAAALSRSGVSSTKGLVE
jgi:imidazoleglycerol-phosphate dehydratase